MRVFKKFKKAYTLTEMMIVMGIIALLLVLGAGGMIGANDDNIADETAQGILSQIRDAQTRAVSITKDSAGNPTKVWAVDIPAVGCTSFSPPPAKLETSLVSLSSIGASYLNTTYIEPAASTKVKPRGGVTICIQKIKMDNTYEGFSTVSNAYATFSTPFARSHTTLNGLYTGFGLCMWKVSTRPEKDWEISASSCGNSKVIDNIVYKGMRAKITYKNSIRYLYVMANGDAYVRGY
jgi:prepilin-type N-terminal cleavage/methylation domain-containing protein